jgi:hypothetical protein
MITYLVDEEDELEFYVSFQDTKKHHNNAHEVSIRYADGIQLLEAQKNSPVLISFEFKIVKKSPYKIIALFVRNSKSQHMDEPAKL